VWHSDRHTQTNTRQQCIPHSKNGVVWGGYGSFKVISNVTIWKSAYDFLFVLNRNYASVLYRFQDIVSYLSKVTDFEWHTSPAYVASTRGETIQISLRSFCIKNHSPCLALFAWCYWLVTDGQTNTCPQHIPCYYSTAQLMIKSRENSQDHQTIFLKGFTNIINIECHYRCWMPVCKQNKRCATSMHHVLSYCALTITCCWHLICIDQYMWIIAHQHCKQTYYIHRRTEIIAWTAKLKDNTQHSTAAIVALYARNQYDVNLKCLFI